MNKPKLIVGIIVILCLALGIIIGSAQADQDLVYRRNNLVDLKVPCYEENGSLCFPYPNTKCNMTVLDPDNSLLVDAENMTYNTNYFNYTMNKSLTDTIGSYTSIMSCIGADDGYSTFNFEITASGQRADIGTALIYIISLIVILSLIGLCIVGMNRDYRNIEFPLFIPVIKSACFFLMYLLFTAMSFITYTMAESFLKSTYIIEFFRLFFRLLMWSMFPILLVSIIIAIFKYRKLKIYQSLLKRGLLPR